MEKSMKSVEQARTSEKLGFLSLTVYNHPFHLSFYFAIGTTLMGASVGSLKAGTSKSPFLRRSKALHSCILLKILHSVAD